MADTGIDLFESLFEDGRTNAVIAWLVVAIYLIVLVESLLSVDLAWVVFTAGALVVLLAPPATERSPHAMLPWELVVLASFPVVVRTLDISALSNTFSMYLSIAALALLVTAELHVLTEVRVTHWFAIVTVVLTTLAGAGLWAIARWWLDDLVNAAYLSTNEDLMREFVWVLLAGLVAGLLFDLYFRRRAAGLRAELGVGP